MTLNKMEQVREIVLAGVEETLEEVRLSDDGRFLLNCYGELGSIIRSAYKGVCDDLHCQGVGPAHRE